MTEVEGARRPEGGEKSRFWLPDLTWPPLRLSLAMVILLKLGLVLLVPTDFTELAAQGLPETGPSVASWITEPLGIPDGAELPMVLAWESPAYALIAAAIHWLPGSAVFPLRMVQALASLGAGLFLFQVLHGRLSRSLALLGAVFFTGARKMKARTNQNLSILDRRTLTLTLTLTS